MTEFLTTDDAFLQFGSYAGILLSLYATVWVVCRHWRATVQFAKTVSD